MNKAIIFLYFFLLCFREITMHNLDVIPSLDILLIIHEISPLPFMHSHDLINRPKFTFLSSIARN